MDMLQTTPEKIKMLSDDKRSLEEPKDIFMALCENGVQNPMTEDEIENLISDIRENKESDLDSFFGSVKSFPDGLSFQREARNEWDGN